MAGSGWIDIEDTRLPRETATVVADVVEQVHDLPRRLRTAVDALLQDATREVQVARRRVEELERRVAASRESERAVASSELRAGRDFVVDATTIERRLREQSGECLQLVQARSAAVQREGRELVAILGQVAHNLDELVAMPVPASTAQSVALAQADVAAAYAVADARQAASLARLEAVASLADSAPAPLTSDELRVVASFAEDGWNVGMQTLGESLAVAYPPASLPPPTDPLGREKWCRSVFGFVGERMGIGGVRLAFFDEGPDANGRMTAGGYLADSGGDGETVRLNRQLLALSGASDLVGTIVHELRHAEQQRVQDGRSFDAVGVLGRNRRALWDKASSNYGWESQQGSVAHTLYLNNPLELDAFACEAVAVDSYEAGRLR